MGNTPDKPMKKTTKEGAKEENFSVFVRHGESCD